MLGPLILLRVVLVLLVLGGAALLLRWVVVGWAYERRPRVWRAAWHSEDGPSQVEVAAAIRRVEGVDRG